MKGKTKGFYGIMQEETGWMKMASLRSTPYATITIKGSILPDNMYYELDVTDLVKEYVSGEYENTGFLIKTHYESSGYVAFHSFECGKEDPETKLDIVYI